MNIDELDALVAEIMETIALELDEGEGRDLDPTERAYVEARIAMRLLPADLDTAIRVMTDGPSYD